MSKTVAVAVQFWCSPVAKSLCYYQCRCSIVAQCFSYQYNMSVPLWAPAAPGSTEKTVLTRSREGSPKTSEMSIPVEDPPDCQDIPLTANMSSKILSGLQLLM